jgi:non-ribosomal peptide synthetase component F
MRKPLGASGVLDLVALAILVLETVATAFAAIGYLVYALLDSEDPTMAAALGGVMAIFAAGVGAFTWGFAKRRRFALSGALAWQLMQASVGVWLLTVWPLVGAILILLAAVVTVAVVRRQADYGTPGASDPS